jgi:hypothetical protein
MKPNPIPSSLETAWYGYLEQRGHRICRCIIRLPVIRSRNGRKARYRWLLLTGRHPKKALGKFERADIRYHIGRAKEAKEDVYLVVGFPEEPRRIIVLPADKALRTRVVRSDKGGIGWEY